METPSPPRIDFWKYRFEQIHTVVCKLRVMGEKKWGIGIALHVYYTSNKASRQNFEETLEVVKKE